MFLFEGFFEVAQFGEMSSLLLKDSVDWALLTLEDKMLHFRKIEDGIHLPADGEVNGRHRVLNAGQFSFTETMEDQT